MTFAIKQEGLWAAIETVYGTEEAIVATDVLEVENLQANPAESIKIIERNIVRNSLAPQAIQYGGSLFGLSFDVEFKGGGAAGTPSRMSRLLAACAMKETIVASTSVTHEPESDTSVHDSLTLFYREGPNMRKVIGARGNPSLNVDAGGRFMFSFTFIGHISEEVVEAPPSETPETTLPPTFRSATFTAKAIETAIGKLSVDLGNTMSIAPDPNSDDSFGEIRIGARKVAGSFDPEAQSIATHDFIGDMRAAQEFALATGVLGTTAGNQIAVNLPRCQYMNIAPGEREALRIYDATFGAFPTTSGDDDVAFQQT